MIIVESGPLEEMKAHVVTTFPDECCGFLYGAEQTNGSRMISTILKVNNSKTGDKKRRFEISGKDYMLAEKFALENNILLLGIYHSHPNHPAIPSEHDRVAALPYFSYVILSATPGMIDHIRSWKLNDETQFEEEAFSPTHLNQSI
ncbi:MAG TPA: M67 family metallopeptidase [Puia sp.]|nr:M67 family metallopeptidase [Puia sp.]